MAEALKGAVTLVVVAADQAAVAADVDPVAGADKAAAVVVPVAQAADADLADRAADEAKADQVVKAAVVVLVDQAAAAVVVDKAEIAEVVDLDAKKKTQVLSSAL